MKTTRIQNLLAVALVAGLALNSPARAADITPTEARAIAKEAYIYGFPMVDSYRIQHAYFVDSKNPEYKLFQARLMPFLWRALMASSKLS